VADGVTKKVRVILRRSLIGRAQTQRRTAWALGLRRVGAARVHALTPALRGALRKVEHLVAVEEVADGSHR
jgi:large subunit ribosomal protein L30